MADCSTRQGSKQHFCRLGVSLAPNNSSICSAANCFTSSTVRPQVHSVNSEADAWLMQQPSPANQASSILPPPARSPAPCAPRRRTADCRPRGRGWPAGKVRDETALRSARECDLDRSRRLDGIGSDRLAWHPIGTGIGEAEPRAASMRSVRIEPATRGRRLDYSGNRPRSILGKSPLQALRNATRSCLS